MRFSAFSIEVDVVVSLRLNTQLEKEESAAIGGNNNNNASNGNSDHKVLLLLGEKIIERREGSKKGRLRGGGGAEAVDLERRGELAEKVENIERRTNTVKGETEKSTRIAGHRSRWRSRRTVKSGFLQITTTKGHNSILSIDKEKRSRVRRCIGRGRIAVERVGGVYLQALVCFVSFVFFN